MNIIKKLSSFI